MTEFNPIIKDKINKNVKNQIMKDFLLEILLTEFTMRAQGKAFRFLQDYSDSVKKYAHKVSINKK